jgi:hypothetical protein
VPHAVLAYVPDASRCALPPVTGDWYPSNRRTPRTGATMDGEVEVGSICRGHGTIHTSLGSPAERSSDRALARLRRRRHRSGRSPDSRSGNRCRPSVGQSGRAAWTCGRESTGDPLSSAASRCVNDPSSPHEGAPERATRFRREAALFRSVMTSWAGTLWCPIVRKFLLVEWPAMR